MAKIQLSQSNFKLISEGVHIFKVESIDDSKYEDFGKLIVKLKNAKGETHQEQFSLLKNDGSLNEGALNAWSYLARTCLNNYNVEDIDTNDLIGCYVQATVKHDEFIATRGERAGETMKAVRLSEYKPATGFETSSSEIIEEIDNEVVDLDDLPF